MQTDAIVAIQDMGAAGLTSSSVEMAGKGGVGIELVLDNVPQRETGMTAYEMMLSESQERMLLVIKPERDAMARAIIEKWDLDYAVIGHITDTGRIVVRHNGVTEADIPLAPLSDAAPLYHRPTTPTPPPPPLGDTSSTVPLDQALLRLLACPDLASRRWIFDQYDSTVGGQTVKRPAQADAAIVRLEGSNRALAMTTDCTPRYCAADPQAGGCQAVAEAWRNLTATGATPLAITDNMNFGNPEKPEIMGQFAAAIAGMAAACTALDFPVVSGNVSLYNETAGHGILPTPAIGARRRAGGRGAGGRPGSAAQPRPRPDRRHPRRPRPIALSARDPGPRSRRRRRRSTWPPNAPMATSSAARSSAAPSPPATTSPMAACWSAPPRWPWPATPAWRCRHRRTRHSGSAKTRPATCWRWPRPRPCWPPPPPPAYRRGMSAVHRLVTI